MDEGSQEDKKPSIARNNQEQYVRKYRADGADISTMLLLRRRKLRDRKNAKPDLQLWLFTVELSVFVGSYDKVASLLLFFSAIINSFVVEVEKEMIV